MTETDYSFDPTPPPRDGMSGCTKLAIGCGVVCVVGFIGAGVGVMWLASNAREFGAGLAAQAFKAALAKVEIPAEQREKLLRRIDDAAQKFADNEMTFDQVEKLFEALAKGPIMLAALPLAAEKNYLEKSGLSDDEKSAAHVTIKRLVYGTLHELIPRDTVVSVLETLTTENNDGSRELHENVSDQQLQAFLDAAKTAADDAEVPDDVPDVNFADEVEKVFDELGI